MDATSGANVLIVNDSWFRGRKESRLGNGSFLTYFFVGEKWGGGYRFVLDGLSMIKKLNEKAKSIFKKKYGLLRFYY